jgi:hypothetical protein
LERNLILKIWQKDLSEEEQLAIKATDSEQSLRNTSGLAQHPRRVRFQVSEWLEGGNESEFYVYTNFTSCGYTFKLGETYLVVASAEKATPRWWTGACMRTQPILSATEDLKALRAWKDGRPLGRRIYGEILDQTQRPDYTPIQNVPILLVRGDARLETKSDLEGRFSFDDLAAAEYRLEIDFPGWRGSPKTADLTNDRCYEAGVYVDQKPDGILYSILHHTSLKWIAIKAVAVDLPEPPSLDLPPIPIQNLPKPYQSGKQPLRR